MSTENNQFPSFTNWHLTSDEDKVLWLKIDKPDASQNVLSADVVAELGEVVQYIRNDNQYKAVVIYSGKKSGFIAGADINEFVKLSSEKEALELVNKAHQILNDLESLKTTTIALIDGVALGGGLELALACKYIVVTDEATTKLGLPEVNLGIHPGFGGTARMIERAGPTQGMSLMLAGRVIGAYQAKKYGIADLMVAKRHLFNSVEFLLKNSPSRAKLSIQKKLINSKFGRQFAAKKMRQQVAKKATKKHYPAPYKLIDLWENFGGDKKEMLKQEAASIASLLTTETSRNLVKVFFMQEELKKLGKRDTSDFSKVEHVHVIGAGVMGGDIAAWCALKGLNVTVSDMNVDALGKAKKRAVELFSKKIRDERLVQAAVDRFVIDPKGDGIAKADVIIEAIAEKLEIKQSVFKEVEKKAKASAILASNTSSIPLEDIAKSLQQPSRLIGIHFFNPVAKMQLVEIINSELSDEVSINRGLAFTKQIGKLPVPAKSSPGFLVNRILMPYLMEAIIMYEEGIPAKAIDKAALDFGMPMGPIELADVVGLDICLHVGETLQSHFGENSDAPKVLDEKVQQKKLGRKTGEGFYLWENGRIKKNDDTEIDAMQQDEITDRLMFRYLNESVACLRELVVEKADWLDGAMIFGTGFAPFRAGPINYIQSQGVGEMMAKQNLLHDKFGARFKADEGWQDL